MNHKPYLDKISYTFHVPAPSGGHDFNSVSNFPSLNHTGIRSQFEGDIIPVSDPQGKLTSDFRTAAIMTLCPILKDNSDFVSREEVFSKGHKQFLDKVLLDLEGRKRDQTERRMKHWMGSKSKLGFTDSFDGNTVAKAINQVNSDFASPNSTNGDIRQDYSYPEKRLTTTSSSPFMTTTIVQNRKKKVKPYNRLMRFEEMMKTTEVQLPPKATKRFGSMVIEPPASSS